MIAYLYDESGSIQGFIYNNQHYYFQKNLQGDVIRILNNYGEVVTEYTYDAWGKVLTTTGTLASTALDKELLLDSVCVRPFFREVGITLDINYQESVVTIVGSPNPPFSDD